MGPQFSALRCGAITLYPITEANFDEVIEMFRGFEDSDEMILELNTNYRPEYDDEGRQTQFGLYAMVDGVLAGASLLGVDNWHDARGYTGADTLLHMRGKGVAPRSKPHLFYLGFEMLGLNRIETGCFVSNTASRRSIEKTPGFQFECIAREHSRNDQGEFEDNYLYAILRRDWERLYDKRLVEVIL